MLEQLTLYTDTVVITSIPNQDPLEFTAQKCGRDVCMSWFAQQDLKHTISHFEVERSSDNNRFRKIDRVKASRKMASNVIRPEIIYLHGVITITG